MRRSGQYVGEVKYSIDYDSYRSSAKEKEGRCKFFKLKVRYGYRMIEEESKGTVTVSDDDVSRFIVDAVKALPEFDEVCVVRNLSIIKLYP